MILKLLSYNIRFGGAGREALIAEVIRRENPHIVIFQEAVIPEIIRDVASESGMSFHAAKKNYSLGCCSRVEIARWEWHSPGGRHPYLEIVPADCRGTIIGLHLRAMFSTWGERRRKYEIEALLARVSKHTNGFHVFLGDFNTVAPNELLNVKKMPRWIRAMLWLSGRDMQRETVQLMLDRGYADGFRALHPKISGYTLPTIDPQLRLDYIFLPAHELPRLLRCEVIDQPPAPAASDHLPLLAHVDFPDV